MSKQRSRWSQKEDTLLEAAVRRTSRLNKVNWEDIATFVPGRSASDCFKRWQRKLSSTFNTGTWSSAEDERLREAVSTHGPRWVVVAVDVGTRSGEQCAKRWNENLNPELNHSPWSPDEDNMLLFQVNAHGKNWKFIAKTAFEARAPLALKNRYSLLMRRQNRSDTNATVSQISSNSSIASPVSQFKAFDRFEDSCDDADPGTPTSFGSINFNGMFGLGNDTGLPANQSVAGYPAKQLFVEDSSSLPALDTIGFSGRNQSTLGLENEVQDQSVQSWDSIDAWPKLMDAQPRPLQFETSGDMFCCDIPNCGDFHQIRDPAPTENFPASSLPSQPIFGPENGLNTSEFSITCQRGRLRSLVGSLMDAAMPEDMNASLEEEVTLTLKLRGMSC